MSNVRLKHLILIFLCLHINLLMNQSVVSITNPTMEINKSNNLSQMVTNLSVLVVLMELPDDPHHPSHTVQHFNDLFFSRSQSFSVRQYYQNSSYGTVDLTGDVLGWFQATENLAYYGAGARIPPGQDKRPDLLVQEAFINAIDEQKDPRNYDLFVIIHSGDGQEYSGNSDDIWSHQWTIFFEENQVLIEVSYSMNHEYVDYSTPSHELGHALLFPDLYDHMFREHIFAGPYGMMGRGESHFSIWNKYYSKLSRASSAQFLTADYRLQITNYTTDTLALVNPIGIENPEGIMWIEIGWNSTGYVDSNHGSGWTITVRENLDYDELLPKHGMVIAEINVGPRTYTQVEAEEYPSWNVVDAHPETEENKDDAAFSIAPGDISTFISGEGWAAQILEKYSNKSYLIRISNESQFPTVVLDQPLDSLSGIYDLNFQVFHHNSTEINSTEVSIDNGPWQEASPNVLMPNSYRFSLNTTQYREGTHIVRVRAIDNASSPYIGYSDFVSITIDNVDGSILVVDDDLGRDAEKSVLQALDTLGLTKEYEVKRTSSLLETDVTAEELEKYNIILWIGNPAIAPISNSHINYNEFKEIRDYLNSNIHSNRSPGLIVMSSYTIFDFSNQGAEFQNDYQRIFRAVSPTNFRAPVSTLKGNFFLSNLPQFTLGTTNTLRANRSSDGEVVELLSGTTPILEDLNPEFAGYPTKGYVVDNGQYKLVNYLFQPSMVPDDILVNLLNATLLYLQDPANGSIPTSTSSKSFYIGPIQVISILAIGGAVLSVLIIRFKPKPRKNDSPWLRK
ncbi:MAG: immune inhibitor A domain-containing protein [Candidatus Hodarchaeales archaeon]